MSPSVKTTGVFLSVGTKKGLFLLHSDRNRSKWSFSGPFLPGSEIYHAIIDPRTGTLFALVNDPWFGNRVQYSKDMGATWQDSKKSPAFPASGPAYQPLSGTSEKESSFGQALFKLERIWHIEPGPASQPGIMYCGVAPAALFRSSDSGVTWDEIPALTNHPTRAKWGPGAGGMCLHSIIVDPSNPDHISIAISAAGVFSTQDGGKTWDPMNSNLKYILNKFDSKIEKYPQVGQCVHHLVAAAGRNPRFYAQTHWGTYRSDDGAKSWIDITEGLPSDFGMLMAAHPRNPDIAYVAPLGGGELRCPPEGKLRVYRTSNGGKTWEAQVKGLPQQNAFMGMYREGMCMDSLEPAGVYLGTNTGQLYSSANEGETWECITASLPPILSVSASAR